MLLYSTCNKSDYSTNWNDFSCIVIYGKFVVRVHSGHLNEYGLVPGGHKLIGQAANLTFESAWRLLYAEYSPIAICISSQP